MASSLDDVAAFSAVARAGGFREGARLGGASPSALSEAVRRLEARLDVRLLNRSTRSVALTEAGARLLERIGPALGEVEAALGAAATTDDRPAGLLKLNVPNVVARLVLPSLVTEFLKAYPGVRMEVVVEDGFVDVLAEGCDAGVRYDERLEQDMVAVPIGPRVQRFATAASPAYLDAHGRPAHPRDLLHHTCVRGRFASGREIVWEFERSGEVMRVDGSGPLLVRLGGGADLMVEAAIAGLGVVHLFEGWLRPYFDDGRLEPVLQDWWQPFQGPYLYYPGRRPLFAPSWTSCEAGVEGRPGRPFLLAPTAPPGRASSAAGRTARRHRRRALPRDPLLTVSMVLPASSAP